MHKVIVLISKKATEEIFQTWSKHGGKKSTFVRIFKQTVHPDNVSVQQELKTNKVIKKIVNFVTGGDQGASEITWKKVDIKCKNSKY